MRWCATNSGLETFRALRTHLNESPETFELDLDDIDMLAEELDEIIELLEEASAQGRTFREQDRVLGRFYKQAKVSAKRYTAHNTGIAELLTMKMTIFHYFIRIGCAVMLLVSGSSAYADSSTHTGKGTFYDYTGGGNCSLPVSTSTLTAAMNATDYANSAACGGFIKVTNNDTGLSVTVRVDDQCPECAPGNVDLDQDAFAQIANLATGIIPIRWQYVANAQAGNLKLYFEGSSSQWWTAVQVRDHRYPIAKLEARLSGSSNAYTSVARESHNYFVASSGLGSGPYDFRITDFWGQTVEIKTIQLIPGVELDTGTQFDVYDAATPTNNSSTAAVSAAANTSGGSGATDWSILLLLGGLVARRLQRG